MKKKIIASLLLVAMLVTLMPVSVFAEEVVTPEQVAQELVEAQRAEAVTGAEAVVMGQPNAAADEALAIANQGFAHGNLVEAVGLTNIAEKAKDFAEDCADDAEAAQAKAEEQHDIAHAAADEAEAQLENAANANTKYEAEAAADAAEEAAEVANTAAAEAARQAEIAQNEADAAKVAYVAAQAAYEAALANLRDGLDDAENAQAAADAAAAEAQAKYEEYLAAAEAAHAATEQAKAEAEKSRQDLADAMDNLNSAIADNAANVLEKTAAVAAIDVALGASKIAVAIAQGTVDYYKGQIEKQEEKLAALEEAITLAEEAIAQAEAELAALDEEDAAYPQAKAALDAAQSAKDSAQSVYDNLGAILDAKDQDEQTGTAATMTELQGAVASGEATVAQKQELTETVLENIQKYDESISFGEINWIDDETFSVDDGEGNVSYYKMETVEGENGEYIQYYKAEESYSKDIDEISEEANTYADSAFSYDSADRKYYADTKYQVKENENTVDVKVKRNGYGTRLSPYTYTYTVNGNELKQDENGDWYYDETVLVVFKTRHDVTLSEKLDDPIYIADDEPISTNSNSISDIWDTASDAENNYNEAVANLEAAQAEYDEAEAAYNAAKTSLEGIIAANENQIENTQEEINKINENLKELDKKLNGGLMDEVVRLLSEGKIKLYDNPLENLKNIPILLSLLPGKSIDEIKEAWDSSVETGQSMRDVIKNLTDGEFKPDDITSVVNLLTDTNLSAETRLAIAKFIERALEEVHDNAVKDLEDAVKKAEEEVAAAAEAAAQAAADAAKKEIAVAQAMAAEAAANLARDIAEAYKNQAAEAAEKAKQAKEDYEKLLNQAEADTSIVDDARQAAIDAQAAADAAAEAAAKAAYDAERANKAAEEAREIADNFPAGKLTAAQFALYLKAYPEVFTAAMQAAGLEENNVNFVKYVYTYVGANIVLNDDTVATAKKNGVSFSIDAAMDSDMFIESKDGAKVDTYGVYVDKNFVEYNDAQSAIVLTDVPADSSACSSVRIDY